MNVTIRIEGMMCAHCEAHVKSALEAIDGVLAADVSRETGLAKVTLAFPVDEAALKAAVEAEGYRVV